MIFEQNQVEVFEALSKKYIWYKTPDEALKYPRKSLAHIMALSINNDEDVELLCSIFGDIILKDVLKNAEIGEFILWNETKDFSQPWIFWHKKLGLEIGKLPDSRFK